MAAGPDSDSDRVLVVVNRDSALSGQIAGYYARKRNIPAARVCPLSAGDGETVTRPEFQAIEAHIRQCLARQSGAIHYLVLTAGFPLRVSGTEGIDGTLASVDSELAPLYGRRKGQIGRASCRERVCLAV